MPSKSLKATAVVIFFFLVVVVPLAISLYHLFFLNPQSTTTNNKSEPFTPPSESRLGIYRTAAVSSDGVPCSRIGRDILAEGGNAVDSAIATLFCIGVVNPQSAGIGGGFLMTLYDSKTNKAVCLNARETAPSAATEDMFGGNATMAKIGALSVAVPGEVAGYWAAHQAYGKLNWSRLVLPSAELAEEGFPVNFHMAKALNIESNIIKDAPSMKIFLNETTGEVLQKGDHFRMPKLAATLRSIAENGVDIFYNGSIGRLLVEDVRKLGGILTENDLLEYKPLWVDPVNVDLKGNLKLYSMPPPGSGVLLASIMKILDGLDLQKTGSSDPLSYHRIAEAMKHAYGQRTKLGDPDFVPEVRNLVEQLISDKWIEETRLKINDSSTSNDPEFYGAVTYQPDDHGTSHVSVLDGDGMAVAATSTVNLYFGARFISEQTGIILNDEMDDFSSPGLNNAFGVPPSPANFIRPGKRPLSSMAPTVVVRSDSGKVRLVIGAAGGTGITSTISYITIRNLWFNETIKEAIDSRRIHHQLFPMSLRYEPDFPDYIITNLTAKGHKRTPLTGPGGAVGPSVACGISTGPEELTGGLIHANSDHRKAGNVDGIDPVSSNDSEKT